MSDVRKILVDVDILEYLLDGFCEQQRRIEAEAESELRKQIARARKAR